MKMYGLDIKTRRTDPPHFHGVPPTFAADVLAAGLDRDRQAATRVRNFVTSAKFAVNKAAVPGAIPTEGRPDLYLDAPGSSTPLLDTTMAPEGITDGAPQIVPQWTSEGSLAGAHTEGQAPASGSFVVSGEHGHPGADLR
ncbi:hypothetical protein [Kribbella sp. NPDC051718]|uniref:hypothetical protein n=1 Tax=Kribbella sp. NPDC051718 TaxID=3155168 RepID=UPI00343EAAFB